MIFQGSTHFKKDQITYYKYVQFNVFLLYQYLSKVRRKGKKKRREGGREGRKERRREGKKKGREEGGEGGERGEGRVSHFSLAKFPLYHTFYYH